MQHFVFKTDALSFLSFANFTFLITKPNLCVISNNTNSLASLKEIEKIPSPVWAQCQQKQRRHLGRTDQSEVFTLCKLGARGTTKRCGLLPPKGDLSFNCSADITWGDCETRGQPLPCSLLYGLLCNSRIIAFKKSTRACNTKKSLI